MVSEKTRDLYLDLLIKAISGTIYGDPSILPASAGTYDPGVRHSGGDWPALAHSMIGTLRLQNVRELATRAIEENVPGHFIETGVWRGGACILMRGVLAAYGVKNRKVYAADSFQGLPPPDPVNYPHDRGSHLHTVKELAISRAEVEHNCKAYNLLDEQVEFLEGWFKDTLPRVSSENFSLVRLDGDLYESTIQALRALYPRLSVGGFIIIDDYGGLATCSGAVEDYRKENGITEPLQTIDWTGRWWQKKSSTSERTSSVSVRWAPTSVAAAPIEGIQPRHFAATQTDAGKTLIFCTAYAPDQQTWNGRYARWLRAITSSVLQYHQILIVDDGSPCLPTWSGIEVVREGESIDNASKVVLYHFNNRLGRSDVKDYPGWFRSFVFPASYAPLEKFTKIIHVESDAFLVSDRIQHEFNRIAEGWYSVYVKKHKFAETAIQVIAGPSIEAYRQFSERPYSEYAGKSIERAIPFTNIFHQFKGARHGEYLDTVPSDADWTVQIFPPRREDPTYYWWLDGGKEDNDPTGAREPFPGARSFAQIEPERENLNPKPQLNSRATTHLTQTLNGALDFELSSHAGPALQFINPEGKVGAAVAIRYEQLSGQGSFQFRVYDQSDGNWHEPFRVNGDEHPPEEPNSRFNRHARFAHGFYAPGVTGPEQASLEFHRDPGQVPFQITSHKTNQPLMRLDQVDTPEDGFPIILVRTTSGAAFTLGRNGDLTIKGALQAGGAVVIDAAVTEPKHAATKAYVDNAMEALRDEIGRLREELIRLRSAHHGDDAKGLGLPQAPDTVE